MERRAHLREVVFPGLFHPPVLVPEADEPAVGVQDVQVLRRHLSWDTTKHSKGYNTTNQTENDRQ